MLKEIHFAGSVCGAFADVSAVELGKVAVEWSGVKPQDVKELLVGNILERRPPPKRPRARSGSGRGFVGGGMGIAMALELT
jgi:hypothetical protein